MESYIVRLDFSAVFDRVNHGGLWFKLKSIAVGGRVLSICPEFLSDRRQRVVVDGAAIEWIPIISRMPQWSVLGPLLFILHTSEMVELVENRLFTYADDSTLLAVVRKPADRTAVAATWLGFRSVAITGAWHWILTILRLESLVDPGVWVLSLVTWSWLGFLYELVTTWTSLAWSLAESSPSKTCAWYCFPCLSQNWYFESDEMHIRGHLYCMLLRCYFEFVLPILRVSFSIVGVCCWMSPSGFWAPGVFGGQDLSRLEFLRRRSMLYKVNSNSNHCLFSEQTVMFSDISFY